MANVKIFAFSFLVILAIFPGIFGQFYGQPEQIHLSFGVDPSVMVVTWTTLTATNESFADFGIGRIQYRTVGTQTPFLNLGSEKRYEYMHRAWMTSLLPGKQYMYRVGSMYGWSSLYKFTAQRTDPSYVPRFVIYGDLGNVNPQSLPRIQKQVEYGMYDAVLHVGDMAYDLFEYNGRRGDEFMNQIQPIGTLIPYMTCPGNHENYGNFSNYKARFTMPGDESSTNLFYSFNLGPVHVISISTEYLFYWQYGFFQYLRQFAWLENDLRIANMPENRAKQPWIITIGHRPMYCSNNDKDDCTKFESLVRTGLPIVHQVGLEDLFYEHGVDVEIWAHEHSYERLWPVYNRKVYNGTQEHPYTNPPAPVHIITGSAGCYSKHDPFKSGQPEWSAYRNTDYGFSRMAAHNSTHLHWQQVSDDLFGAIVDDFWIIKDTHGPYPHRG